MGRDFDDALFRAERRDVFDLGRQPAHLGERVSRRSTAVRALSNDEVRSVLSKATRGWALLREVLYGGFAYELFQAVERAKIELSTAERAAIALDRPGIRLDVPVTPSEFEVLIRRDSRRCSSRSRRRSGKRASSRQTSIPSSARADRRRIPLFVDRLQEMFSGRVVERPPVERPPYDTIATGLGLHARKVWT